MRSTRFGLLGLVAAFAVFSGCSCNKTPTKTSSGSTSGTSAAGSGAGSTTAGTGSTSASTSGTSGSGSSGSGAAATGTGSGSGSGSATTTGGSGSGSATTSAGTSGGSTGSTSLDAGLLAYCEGSGAPVSVGDSLVDGGQSATCAGNLAQRTFRFALCTCDQLNVQQHLITDSFLYMPDGGLAQGRFNGAVGVDNGLHTGQGTSQNAQFSVGGSLYVSDGGIVFDVASTIQGQLWSGGPVGGASSSFTSVAPSITPLINAAYVGADLNTKVNINGNLVIIDGGLVGNQVNLTHAGASVIRDAVTVEPPCNCDDPLDIAGIVTSHATDNDDAQIGLVSDAGFGDGGLDPTLWAGGTGPATFTFPCGRYYLSHTDGGSNAVDIETQTTWDIAGRTALLIDGDFTLGQTSGLNITFEPGAELDIFINGNLSFGHVSTIGTLATSANMRWYVGGTGQIDIVQSPVTFSGNLYAPNSVVNVGANLTVNGALFCKDLVNNANVSIHYGENILAAGQECTPGTTGTTSSGSGSTSSTGSGSTSGGSTSGTTTGGSTTGGTTTGGSTTGGTVDAGPQCSSCTDCNNQACVNGVCGSCTTDAQCCSPLVCDQTSHTCIVLFK